MIPLHFPFGRIKKGAYAGIKGTPHAEALPPSLEGETFSSPLKRSLKWQLVVDAEKIRVNGYLKCAPRKSRSRKKKGCSYGPRRKGKCPARKR